MRQTFAPPLVGVAVLALLSCRPAAADGDLLATAPIDPTLFRDGEVQRTTDVYGTWTLVCDAIPRLHHRFCSLRAASGALGAGKLDLTVSTGDDGRPAALLRLPLGLSLPFGVRVEPQGRSRSSRRIPIALCSATSCEAAWSLSQDDISALSTGGGIKISVKGWHAILSSWRSADPPPVRLTIDGRGFSAAISASLR